MKSKLSILGTESRRKLKFGEVSCQICQIFFFFLREKRVKYFPAECPFKLYYAKAFTESVWPNSASLYPRATSFEMLQRWRAVGNTVSDLTPQLFEPQTCS